MTKYVIIKNYLKKIHCAKEKLSFMPTIQKKKKKSSNIDNQFIIKCKETWR